MGTAFVNKVKPQLDSGQTSCCFRAAWTKGQDLNEKRRLKELWALDIKDIDLVPQVLNNYMLPDKKCCLIVNVASA